MLRTQKRKAEENQNRIFRYDKDLFDLKHACMSNAIDLLNEARILYQHKRYARCFALAFTAYEEVGKSQIVADFITGVVSESEFVDAFRSHKIKSAYLNRILVVLPKDMQDVTVSYDLDRAKGVVASRNASLYVNLKEKYTPLTPKMIFRAKHAKDAMKAVYDQIHHINFAERFNERIGTEALAK